MRSRPLRRVALLPVWALLLAACGSGSGGGGPKAVIPLDGAVQTDAAPGPAPDATPDAAPPASDAAPAPAPDAAATPDAAVDDPALALFSRDRLLDVALQIDPADWDALRVQARDGIDTRKVDCLGAPFPSPYTWFHGQVSIDGVLYADVGVHKKGFFGSLNDNRPSLVIDLDKYVDGQTDATVSRFTLNNNNQDPASVRTCLAYDVFAAAGVPAPRCSFARVRVNGRDLGVYTHVETYKKPFFRRYFASDTGHLYEGQLSDFRPGWTGTLEQKNDESNPDTAPIDRLVAAAAADDAHLLGALGDALDLDAFLTFWATEVLISHWDGYAGDTNNFFIYDEPQDGAQAGKIQFLPWGPDATFQTPQLLFEGADAPASVLASGILARRLYLHPEGRARYVSKLRDLLAHAWNADTLSADVDAMDRLIQPALPAAGRRGHTAAIDALKAFIAGQAGRVTAELDAGPVPWSFPLRGSPCVVEAGHVSGTFATTWGSWPTDNAFPTGTGTLTGQYHGDELTAGMVGAAAGPSAGHPDRAQLVVPAQLFGGGVVFLFVDFPILQAAPGVIALDGNRNVGCSYNRVDNVSHQVVRLGSCLDGTVTFEAASSLAGEPFNGSFDVGLWEPAPPGP